MAEWLGGWLRDIVLVVLTAAFVDLLVPDNALKKYVRLTISLMILLTILDPLIGWLKPGLDVREEAFFAMEAGSAGMPPLESVLEAGDERRAALEARSFRLAEEQVAGQIRRQVSRAFPVAVVAVDVRLGPGEAGAPDIQAVTLVLAPFPGNPADGEPDGEAGGGNGNRESGAGGGSGDDRPIAVRSGMKPVVRVEPVAVTVPGDRQGGSAGAQAGTGTGRGAARDSKASDAADKRRLAADVAAQLAAWWGIEERRIDVIWDDGPEDDRDG